MKSENATEEKWIQLKRFNNFYSISNFGRIKSHERTITKGRLVKESVLKPILTKVGYYCVNITYPKRRQYHVHRLFCEAFYGESSLFVNHKDFNKLNNMLYNLEYCTQKENIEHSIIGGRNGQILLDSVSGIFYTTYQDAANAIGMTANRIQKMMSGKCINKTQLIKV